MQQIHQRTGGYPPYTAEQRAQQLRRLKGKMPSEKERGAMAWPSIGDLPVWIPEGNQTGRESNQKVVSHTTFLVF